MGDKKRHWNHERPPRGVANPHRRRSRHSREAGRIVRETGDSANRQRRAGSRPNSERNGNSNNHNQNS